MAGAPNFVICLLRRVGEKWASLQESRQPARSSAPPSGPQTHRPAAPGQGSASGPFFGGFGVFLLALPSGGHGLEWNLFDVRPLFHLTPQPPRRLWSIRTLRGKVLRQRLGQSNESSAPLSQWANHSQGHCRPGEIVRRVRKPQSGLHELRRRNAHGSFLVRSKAYAAAFEQSRQFESGRAPVLVRRPKSHTPYRSPEIKRSWRLCQREAGLPPRQENQETRVSSWASMASTTSRIRFCAPRGSVRTCSSRFSSSDLGPRLAFGFGASRPRSSSAETSRAFASRATKWASWHNFIVRRALRKTVNLHDH